MYVVTNHRMILTTISRIMTVVLIAGVAMHAGADETAPGDGSQAGLRIESPTQWQELPPYFFGLDTNIPATAGLHADAAPWDDAKMVAAMKELSIGMLRYPGGLSPFYNWRTQHQEAPHPFGRKLQDWMLKVHGNQAGFLDLCKQLDIRPVFVFNILQGDPADQREWVDSLVGEDGRPVVTHWELGNEVPDAAIFKKDRYKGPIQTPQDYIAASKAISEPLLKRWPDLRIAIVGAPPVHIPQLHVPKNEKPETREWNEALGADRSYYNAVVQHFYGSSGSCVGRT